MDVKFAWAVSRGSVAISDPFKVVNSTVAVQYRKLVHIWLKVYMPGVLGGSSRCI